MSLRIGPAVAALGSAYAVLLSGCGHGSIGVVPDSGAAAVPSSMSRTQAHPFFAGAVRPDGSAEVCGPAAPGFARCDALVRLDAFDAAVPNSGAYGPADLVSAYKLPAAPPTLQTVAIVDAFDDPHAASDLATYRTHFGLAPCTTASGCFRKVNQLGNASPLPTPDTGWAEEISLDLDMVSATCPSCHILLVESNNSGFGNLAYAVRRAVLLGANVISNSYGSNPCDESEYATWGGYYNHPGHAITASAGDGGYCPQFPADSPYVTAVGGTHLARSTNTRGWHETAWNGTGSGCSKKAPKPMWQVDTGCAMRTIADVSADADPGTGVYVYQSYGVPAGFYVVGGTSVSAPIIAGVYALAGNASTITYAKLAYTNKSHLFDVKSGANGVCGGSYLCTALAGYDGPTGNGTPNGIAAF